MATNKKLLVEGKDDCRTIPHLMGHHVHWPDDKKLAPVEILDCEGGGNVWSRLSLHIKSNILTHIGVVVDADGDGITKWNGFRNSCLPQFPSIPESLPEKGLILNENGMHLGFWMMPNNVEDGMLETFLSYLVSTEHMDLWRFSETSSANARSNGATYKDSHMDKAKIHTFLAWIDPPGTTFGIALKKKVLDPNSENATPFVEWFRKLFEL